MQLLRNKKSLAILVVLLTLNAALYLSVQSDLRVMRDVAYSITPPGAPVRQVVEEAAAYARDKLSHQSETRLESQPFWIRWNYRYNRLRVGPATIVRYGTSQLGPCQSNSRLFHALLESRGINSSLVVLHDDELVGWHSAIEVDDPAYQGVIDPGFDIVYRHPDGRPATLKDLRHDQALFLANASRGWSYTYGPDVPGAHTSYPANQYYFTYAAYFNWRRFGPLRWPLSRVLTYWFGPDGVLVVPRPNFIMWPAYCAMVLIDTLAVLAVTLMLLIKRRKNKGQSGTRMSPPAQSTPKRETCSALSRIAAKVRTDTATVN